MENNEFDQLKKLIIEQGQKIDRLTRELGNFRESMRMNFATLEGIEKRKADRNS